MFVFDTCSLRKLGGFNKVVFATLWERIDDLVHEGTFTSVREVLTEVADRDDDLHEWCKTNSSIFTPPSVSEVAIVGEILSIPRFFGTLPKQNLLSSRPFADPYIIAKAKYISGTVVTEEKDKPNSSKIPSICKELSVRNVSLDGFMLSQGWKF